MSADVLNEAYHGFAKVSDACTVMHISKPARGRLYLGDKFLASAFIVWYPFRHHLFPYSINLVPVHVLELPFIGFEDVFYELGVTKT